MLLFDFILLYLGVFDVTPPQEVDPKIQLSALRSQFTDIATSLQLIRAGLSGDEGNRLKVIMSSLQDAGTKDSLLV